MHDILPYACVHVCACACVNLMIKKEIVVCFFFCPNFYYLIIKGLKPSVIYIHMNFHNINQQMRPIFI